MSKEKPDFYVNSQDPERSVFRHKLIEEFRKDIVGRYEVPGNADGVVVLSAPPELEYNDNVERREKTPENISRIDFAFDIWKQLATKKLGKDLRELADKDLQDPSLPLFVLNGETEQLKPLKEIAIALGVPREKVHLVDCGRRGIGNTRTQFTEISRDQRLSGANNLIFVTSSYHVPRVVRTGDVNLPKEMDFDVVGVPFDRFSYDIRSKIRGEIKRIVAYSKNGDIAKHPRGG